MKENTLFILKEVAICLGLAIIAVGINVFLFKDYIVANIDVEEANTNAYAAVKRDRYNLIGEGIEDAQNPTQKYETVDGELDVYTTELRYIQGTINPFVSESSDSDLPTEVVGISGDITEQKK